jgi:hypothetical protein
MTTWTPPSSSRLSRLGDDHVVAGLTNPDSRDAALAFLAEHGDMPLLYSIARRLGWELGWEETAHLHGRSNLRDFIRNRV